MTQSDFRQLVEELAGEALGDHLRNVRSFAELRRAIASGALTDRDVNEAYSEYARRNGPEYRKAASDLTMRYYQDLSELSAQYSDTFYAEILNGSYASRAGSDTGTGHGESRDESFERIPIELHGRMGHEIAARFTVENTDPEPRTIEFEFEPCRSPTGDEFNAPATVQPGKLRLESGASAAVVLRVALMPSVFMPGLIYQQAVRVIGAKPLLLDVTLWVEDDDPPTPEPTQKRAPAPATTATTAAANTAATAEKAASKKTAAKKPVARKAATKKAAGKKTPAKKAATKKAAAKKTPAKKATTKKAPAKKTAAKKTSAKQAATKKAPAKKTAAERARGS